MCSSRPATQHIGPSVMLCQQRQLYDAIKVVARNIHVCRPSPSTCLVLVGGWHGVLRLLDS